MKTKIYVSHATLFVFDAEEKLPGNHWTERHWKQKFARRATAMNLVAVVEEDGFIVELETSFDALNACSSVTSFSLHSPSGRILLSGESPGGEPIWSGRAGWVRVTVGQVLLRDAEPPEIRVVVVAEEAVGEERTIVRNQPDNAADYLESAEPAQYSG